MSWWTADRERYAYIYLTANGGLSPYGAAGLVSRWANVEAPNGPASRGGYLGRAWGIAQWLGSRLTPINGNASYGDQLAYVVQELNGLESRAAGLLRSAYDAQSGAKAATAYERADGWNAGTNTDNFTARTAAGIASVLANVGGASVPQQVSSVYNDDAITGEPSPYATPAPIAIAAGISTGAIVALSAGVMLLYLLLDD